MQSMKQVSTNEAPGPTLVEREIQSAHAAESISIPGESSPGYYGWCVVLATCSGVMAGFGSLFRLHVFGFCETPWPPISAGRARPSQAVLPSPQLRWVRSRRCWAGGSTVSALAISFWGA